MPSFYEFFCGGGMARAGLEPEWRCLFANDIDPRKGSAYAANWGSEELRIADVALLRAADLPGLRRSRLGLVSLSGSLARGRWSRASTAPAPERSGASVRPMRALGGRKAARPA